MADNNPDNPTEGDTPKGNEPEGDKPKGGEGDVADSGLKEKLEEALGKEFKDDETLIKSLKDTQSYVGKKIDAEKLEGVMTELKSIYDTDESGVLESLTELAKANKEKSLDEKFVSKQDFEDKVFWDKEENKPFLPLKEALVAFAKSQNLSLDAAKEAEGFKPVLEAHKKATEADKSKSVLETNPRLGQATDKISQARESANKGDHIKAGDQAADAVIDAFEI